MAFDSRKVRYPFLRKVLEDIFGGVTAITGIKFTAEALSTTSTAAVTVSASLVSTTLNFTANNTLSLAAPDSSMIGRIKIIEDVQTATNTISLPLGNVEGYTATSSATFDASGEKLILVGGQSNWKIIEYSTGVIA